MVSMTPNNLPFAVHLITLSALASTFGGIVRPICFAVFRLITKHVLSSFEGAALCHFDRREKSFSDPSHSLGMTGFVPSLRGLGVLGVLARANPRFGYYEPPENLRKPRKLSTSG